MSLSEDDAASLTEAIEVEANDTEYQGTPIHQRLFRILLAFGICALIFTFPAPASRWFK